MTTVASPIDRSAQSADALCAVGAEFHRRGWSLGTSSNYSLVTSRTPFRLLITASGMDKSSLTRADFVTLDEHGQQIDNHDDRAKPSAEAMLHVATARRPGVGAVLHTHSVWATTLSDLYHADGALFIEGYEMLKGLNGIKTHDHRERLEIIDNTQDIRTLAQKLTRRFDANDPALTYGFLLHKHGLYAWGRDLAEARRHIEIFEFLFEVIGRTLMLKGARTR
jgi:methylthioribulose-1-phosphate dehydratase